MELPGFLRKIGFCLFARPFVAGETIDDAIKVVRKLKKKRIYAIINILGEHVKDWRETTQIRKEYIELIIKLKREGLDNAHISIKPSQLGAEISKRLYRDNLYEILAVAQFCLPGALVEIDRETHEYAEAVREVSLDLVKTFSNQRLCCQINLDETLEEIKQLIGAGVSIRLCKGTAYPGDIEDEGEIRKRFLEQAPLLSKKGNRPAIATHDLYLIDKLNSIKNLGFQVLLGIENKKMERMARGGIEVGFYVPCGPYWYLYGKRRWKSVVKILWRNFYYRIKKG